MKKPFLALWVAYIIGIYLDYSYDIPQNTYIYLLCISGAMFLALKILQNKTSYTLALTLSLLMGGLFFNIDYRAGVEERYGAEIETRVRVVDQVTIDKDYERYIVEELESSDKLLLTFYENTELAVGDVLSVKGELEEIRQNTNPKLFSPRDYYRSQYVYGNIVSKSKDVELLEKNRLNYWEANSRSFIGYVEKAIDSSMSSEDKAIVKSMILGDSNYIEQDKLESLRDMGLGHMIAVSGLHIGILFGALLFLMKDILGFHKRIAETLGIGLVWSYIILIGFPISSVRAGIMVTMLIISKCLHKRYDTVNIISFVGLMMILLRPLWALSLGYQLSFTGVLALSISGRGKLKALFGIFFGLLPLNMYYFNVMPVISIATNLVVVPILSLALVVSLSILPLYGFSPVFSEILGKAVDTMLAVSEKMLDVLEIYHRNIPSASPELLGLLIFYTVILVAMKAVDIRVFGKRVLSVFVGYSVLVGAVMAILPVENSTVEFIDVNQGDCALINVSGKHYMIDSGGSVFSEYDVGEQVVYPYLLKHGVKKLDGFVVSHFDADHIKGFLYVMDQIQVKEIIIGYRSPENELYNELLRKAEAKGIPVRLVEKPSVIELDSENRLSFIPPGEYVLKSGENNSSMVVMLESFGKRVLFTGDIESEREDELVELDFIKGVDVIKVPHHGSATSSTESLLEVTRPSVAVFQVGKNNFGHPNPEVLERYKSVNASIYRNDESGMIKLTMDRDKFTIEEYKKKKSKLAEMLWEYRLELAVAGLETLLWIYMLSLYKAELGNREEKLEESDWTTENF